jgi:ribosomal protein S18 acetylase RimI-like enzyme
MIEIRRVGPNDAALLTHVADDVFDSPIVADRLAAYLADPTQTMVLAIAGGIIVGQARGAVVRNPDDADTFYIDNLGVTPGWQRRGVATRLIDALADHARWRGCASIWVATEPANAPANALYANRTGVTEVAYYEWPL